MSMLALVGAATAQAQDAPNAYLGDRMPYAVFDQLPLTRITVPSGGLAIGIAPGALDLPRERLLDWIERCANVVATYLRADEGSTRARRPRRAVGSAGGAAGERGRAPR